MNLLTLLEARAAEHPERPAILDGPRGRERVTDYRRLHEDAARLAALLGAHGIGAGDAVLVLQPMSRELYLVLLALFRLGAVAMFLDPSAGRAHVAQCCAMGRPVALIASPRAHLLRLALPALRAIPRRFVTRAWLPGTVSIRAADRLAPCTRLAPGGEAPALLTFTSGSTGRPKAALRSHSFLLAQHAALAQALDLREGQRDLTTLPIFLLANLASGLTSLIPDTDLRRPGAIRAAPVLAQARALGIERCGASPAFLERLVEQAEADGRGLPFSRMDTGGAPVFPVLLDRLRRQADGARIVAVYGSTEAEPMAEIEQREIDDADRSAMQGGAGLLAGRPVDAVTLRILPDRFGTPVGPYTLAQFEQDTLPPGEVGEIVVCGAHVLPGYLHGEGDRDTKFEVDGLRWHRTGDAGWLDASGRLWLMGRCSARIDDARGRLYPFAVECAAGFWPGVRRCAMVAHRGQRLLLVEGEVDVAALKPSLQWAHLDALRSVKRLPMDRRHNAKIDYPRLAAMLERG